MIYVGIDTGVKTGFAVYDSSKKKFIDIKTLKIHQAMKNVYELTKEYPRSVVVKVEDPRKRTWFGTEMMTRDEERKRLQGVGSVKRDASVWEDFLSDLRIPFEMVSPKRNKTKIDPNQFKIYANWDKRTSEHSRDAAMLVIGF